MNEKTEKKPAIDEAWRAFEKTGKISYYMLYNELKKR